MLRKSFDLLPGVVLVVGLNISSALIVPKFEIVLCNSYACSMVVVPKVDVCTFLESRKELAFVFVSCNVIIIKDSFLRFKRGCSTGRESHFGEGGFSFCVYGVLFFC